MAVKRRDSNRIVLWKGESQRKNGTYVFRWQEYGERHCFYAKTLNELRLREEELQEELNMKMKIEGSTATLNDIFNIWKEQKKGIKNNTRDGYLYNYEMFIRKQLGNRRIRDIKKSDVKKYYNSLVDGRGFSISTLDNIHTVLHQIFDVAVGDQYIRVNPADNALRELKRSHVFQEEKRHALTKAEQELLLNFLRDSVKYYHWYPLFAVLCGTGMRIGEVTGLRWSDIDLEEGKISVNHTLLYYDHRNEEYRTGCYHSINTPKTEAGCRTIPMLESVKEAFLMEKAYQELHDLHCKVTIDGYTDFIFINREGNVQNQATVNKAIKRITRDCNDAEFLKNPEPKVLLPNFSSHSLRHSFTTRMCEAGMNVKVMQEILGHRDIRTTLNIYADVTKDMEDKEMGILEGYLKQ